MRTKTPILNFKVKDILKKRKKSPHFGCCCTFVKISDEWGIKLYSDKSDRDYAYKLQKYCRKHKLAPQVGDCVKVGEYFGYITEVAETPIYGYKSDKMKISLFDTIQQKYLKVGLSFWDVHGANCGRLADGRYVSIDFGDESMRVSSRKAQNTINQILVPA